MNINIDSANESLKLNANNMQWSHFSNRPRYDKSDNNRLIGYDRFICGVLAGGKSQAGDLLYPFLLNKYQADEVVTIFNLGHKNLVFAHKAGDSTIYVNKNIRAQAVEYVKFYARAVREQVGEVEIVFVDDFPTAVIQRDGGGTKVDSLEALVNKAMNNNIEVVF